MSEEDIVVRVLSLIHEKKVLLYAQTNGGPYRSAGAKQARI